MKRILRSDWLPEQKDVAHVWLFQSQEKKFSFWPYNKSFIDQACSVMVTGH